jgi:proteasome lid subunit RPN8/RPN11
LVDALVSHARQGFPDEACGMLALEGDRVVKFYPMRNAKASPVYFEMDSQEQLRAFLDIEDHEWRPVVFHSHTHTAAYPSATDVRFAEFYPEALHVLVSLARPDAPQIRAFEIVDGRIEEQPVEQARD